MANQNRRKNRVKRLKIDGCVTEDETGFKSQFKILSRFSSLKKMITGRFLVITGLFCSRMRGMLLYQSHLLRLRFGRPFDVAMETKRQGRMAIHWNFSKNVGIS
ncbi:unnamed protein product [Linum trigynum]|uniref:Transposase n=1 Tax=Linum trigynum TaxID=586398 RepID=A0AAV2E3S4_9ROSI